MKLMKLCLTTFFLFVMGSATANVSNAEGAGQCVGMMLTGSSFKIPTQDWSVNAKTIFSKYSPNVQRLAPIVDGCTQGSTDINKFKSCVSKLPNQQDREFVAGLNDGLNMGKKYFSSGGATQLKSKTEITCSGLK